MFRALGTAIDPDPTISGPQVFELHPMQLSRYLELVWQNRLAPVLPTLLEVPGGGGQLAGIEANPYFRLPGVVLPTAWDHLIYAYMVDNTRAFDIIGRVLEEYAFGERLGTPRDETQRWLRTTEQLFYTDASPLQIYALTSWIRPDLRASRRNAYLRMFGMDLNHGTVEGRPYPYPRPVAANVDFATTFENLLREVWRGIENFTNTSGPRGTDDAAIANLASDLYNMLLARRGIGGNLNREEFVHVSAMSWLHLTLSFNSPVVLDLQADAGSPEERLFKIGARVGLPAHSRSGAYFRLADTMSYILRLVEAASFNTPATANLLYTPLPVPPPPPALDISDVMQEIVRDWSIATGRDMKSRPIGVTPPAPRPPLRMPPATPPRGDTTTNGRGPHDRPPIPV